MTIHFPAIKRQTGNQLIEVFHSNGELVKLGTVYDPNLYKYSNEYFHKFYHKKTIYYIFSKRTDDYTAEGLCRKKVKIIRHKRGGITIDCHQIIPMFNDIYII